MSQFQIIRTLITMLMVIASLPSNAAIYKCIDASGNVSLQELPCSSDSTGDEVTVRGSVASLSPEEKAWLDSRKPMIEKLCIDEFAATAPDQLLSPELRKQICECGVNRYLSNPISQLRALEEAKDIEGNKKLFRPAMTSCAKEIIDKQP